MTAVERLQSMLDVLGLKAVEDRLKGSGPSLQAPKLTPGVFQLHLSNFFALNLAALTQWIVGVPRRNQFSPSTCH